MLRSDTDTEAADDTAAIVVRVVRTGGFAGLRREWTAKPGSDDTSVWVSLIDGCPWDDALADGASRGADRFVWVIEARCSSTHRTAKLGDDDMHGPWRTLVDAVRDFAAPAAQRCTTAESPR